MAIYADDFQLIDLIEQLFCENIILQSLKCTSEADMANLWRRKTKTKKRNNQTGIEQILKWLMFAIGWIRIRWKWHLRVECEQAIKNAQVTISLSRRIYFEYGNRSIRLRINQKCWCCECVRGSFGNYQEVIVCAALLRIEYDQKSGI